MADFILLEVSNAQEFFEMLSDQKEWSDIEKSGEYIDVECPWYAVVMHNMHGSSLEALKKPQPKIVEAFQPYFRLYQGRWQEAFLQHPLPMIITDRKTARRMAFERADEGDEPITVGYFDHELRVQTNDPIIMWSI